MHRIAKPPLDQLRAKLRRPEPFKGLPGQFLRASVTQSDAATAEAEGRSLGSNAKSFTPPQASRVVSADKRVQARAERYELQAVARNLLYMRGVAKGLEYPANYHQTAKCLYTPFSKEVTVNRSAEHGNAFYGGLVVCGRPGCPVCAAKVGERRRQEIAHAFEWAYAQREGAGKKMVMVTFTHPHRSSDALAGQLKRQSKAFARLRAGEPWKRILPSGYTGLIRSLEVTYGRHGWHPHTHEAWMVDKDADVSDLRRKIVRRWYGMLKKVGMLNLPPSGKGARFAALRGFYKHSVDVLDNARSSDYLAKHDADSTGGHWGADRELAKGSTKKGRAAGRTPFQLLADCRDGDEKSGRLYLEYVEAMRGKPPIFWSSGLKSLVGLQEFKDQQIAEREDDAADVLGAVELRDWALVRWFDYRAHLLQAAETGGWAAVQALIAELRCRHGKTSIKQEWAVQAEQRREFTVVKKHPLAVARNLGSGTPEGRCLALGFASAPAVAGSPVEPASPAPRRVAALPGLSDGSPDRAVDVIPSPCRGYGLLPPD
jgi:hypothetical protein